MNGAGDPGIDSGEETLSPSQLRRLQASRVPPDPALGGDPVVWAEDDRIAEILADELNEGANLEISRKDKFGKWCHLCIVPLLDWNPTTKQDLANKYGGGDYKGQVRRMADGVRGQRGHSFQFTIDHALKPVGADTDKPAAQDPFAVFERMNAQNPIMPLFMQMMRTQQDNMAMMMQMQQQHTATLVATLKSATPVATPPSERLMEVLLTKALAPGASPTTDLAGLLTVVGKLKALVSDTEEPREREGGGLIDKLLTALPAVLSALARAQVPPPAEPAALPPHPASPAPAPAPAPSLADGAAPEPAAGPVSTAPTLTPEQQQAAATQAALAAFLPQIVALADQGHAPEAVAQQISDTLDDQTFLALSVLLERPDWLAVLADAHDQVLSRSPWFTELREHVLALTEEDDAAPGS